MKCAHCQHFDTTTHKNYFKLGLAWCKARGIGVFVSLKRDEDCKLFKEKT